ncbi:hypothetical protein LTR85_003647 [Meristemomyces frigidus]|nr:hypothetical protein LTR85_003647 [Meristemomyces frigidus]
MSEHSAFLSLPLEMRTRIYEFVGEPRISIDRLRSRQPNDPIPSHSHLMLVSHQVRDEYYSHLLRYPFVVANTIVVPIKNFNFRPFHTFLASCSEDQLGLLRGSDPPLLVAQLRFCKHFREHTRSQWEDMHIGRWFHHRRTQPDDERIPLRYELGPVETAYREILGFTVTTFSRCIPPHPDVVEMVSLFKPYFAGVMAEGMLEPDPDIDLCDTSASSESEGETATRDRMRRTPNHFTPVLLRRLVQRQEDEAAGNGAAQPQSSLLRPRNRAGQSGGEGMQRRKAQKKSRKKRG